MSTNATRVAAQKRAVDVTRAPAAPGGALLPAVIRSEWTKLRSVRSTIWSLVATIGITAGLGMLFCFAYTRRFDKLGLRERLTFDPTAQSLRGLFLAQLAIGVLGVLVISSEHATGLIRTTLTAVPQRRAVLAAKTVVFGAVAVVVTTIAVFIAFFAGQAVLETKDLGVSITDPHVLRAVLGAGAYLSFVGLFGLAIGTIVRRTAGGIATLVGVVLVLPLLAQALPSPWNNDIAKFLPGGLGAALFSVRSSTDRLSPGAALVVALIWLVATFTIATLLISRRDA
jgi:ABC-2 type transport system permease protein